LDTEEEGLSFFKRKEALKRSTELAKSEDFTATVSIVWGKKEAWKLK
jgi:hypothetical protein